MYMYVHTGTCKHKVTTLCMYMCMYTYTCMWYVITHQRLYLHIHVISLSMYMYSTWKSAGAYLQAHNNFHESTL